MILASHSPIIEDDKSLFFLNFNDIKLMRYVIYNDPTLLHQTIDGINKVYEKKLVDFYSNQCLERQYL